MCLNKKKLTQGNEEMSSDSDDDDSSDMSVSDSSSDDETQPNTSNADTTAEKAEESEEDDLIKALWKEKEAVPNHPAQILCEDYITDISFHPQTNILAAASVVGDVTLYNYSVEGNNLIASYELHTRACRDVEFDEEGKVLYSAGKDKSILLTDAATGQLIRFYDKAHDSPINCLTVLSKNLFATGDDGGTVKLWDARTANLGKHIYSITKNEDYISDIVTNEVMQYLVCSSGDGSLTTVDLRNKKLFMQSELYEEEFTSMGLFRSETKVVSSSSKGNIMIFNWGEFGLHSDIFPSKNVCINQVLPITENILITACEDGILRAVNLFPHRHLGIVGQHDSSIEKCDINNDGTLIASTSHDDDIKFWNIEYFQELVKLDSNSKHNKNDRKKELLNNLPSSKCKNRGDFFSGLC